MFQSVNELTTTLSSSTVRSQIDSLIKTALFSPDSELKKMATEHITQTAKELKIYPSSTKSMYDAVRDDNLSGFTVPAINIRTLTYDISSLLFTLIETHQIGLVIFEIARSEMEYTYQDQQEFSLAVLAGAIKAGYTGPVFLQADHYQVRKKRYAENSSEELTSVKDLIVQALTAGFYNIDIDGSTLVDLSKPTVPEQQKENIKATVELTEFILQNKPQDKTVTIGAEIGHIGDNNSTKEDLDVFMQGVSTHFPEGTISKLSIQTGTNHGGSVQPDGTLKTPSIDFDLIEDLGVIAKKDHGLAGVVQHGASTLPLSLFSEFPKHNTLEIHLSTGIQNIVYDHLPEEIKQQLYSWVDTHCGDAKKPEWSNEQWYYKLRKKALGPNKELLWNLSEEEKKPILAALGEYFTQLFTSLNMLDTKAKIEEYY